MIRLFDRTKKLVRTQPGLSQAEFDRLQARLRLQRDREMIEQLGRARRDWPATA